MKGHHRGEPEPGLLVTSPVIERSANAVREQFGRLSAYRLGWRMGYSGQLQWANPYGEDTRRGERYATGWCEGYARRCAMKQQPPLEIKP